MKNKIVSLYSSLKAFNNEFFKINSQTFSWPFKTRNGHNFRKLIKISNILEISNDELFTRIKGFYSWGSHNQPVNIDRYLEINEKFVEGYSLYIAEGDTGDSGKTKPRKLRFTNSEPSVINFYIDWLNAFFPNIDYYVVAILPRKGFYIDNTNEINFKLRFQRDDYNKQIKYRVCMDNSIIIDLILAIRTKIREIVFKDKKLMCAYLQGLMAGEGTVYNNRSKYVRLEMKNSSEIAYVKNLFRNLEIKFTSHQRTNRPNMESIYIGGRDNISKYYELIGFGSQRKRQKKLRDLIYSYKQYTS